MIERATESSNAPLGSARFRFTIVDDTDGATIENVRPVYALLDRLGIRTTKTVWVYRSRDRFRGESLQDEGYLDFIRELRNLGFEIALHSVGSGSFNREEIAQGLDIFAEKVGAYPTLQVNHAQNPDSLYWGVNRFRPPLGWLYSALPGVPRGEGATTRSPHFWGDLASKHIRYVRNLTFRNLNVRDRDPWFPYHDPTKPYVQQWFSSSHAPDASSFARLLSPSGIDALSARRGVCIIYTHFAEGFVEGGKVRDDVASALAYVASKGGAFAPATATLDALQQTTRPAPSEADLRSLENAWLMDRIQAFGRQ